MRFLVDQPISWQVAHELTSQGHDAIHVRDVGLAISDDDPIVEYAIRDNRIIVTQDTDYGTLLVTAARVRPSVILFRMRDGRPRTQLKMLTAY